VAPAELSAREAEVARLAAEDLTNDAIADRLGISTRTVEAHLRMVFRKTGVSRRTELAAGRVDSTVPSPSAGGGERGRVGRLQRELALRERQLASFEKAMGRLIDRQFPLYGENVDMTIKIGSSTREDVVIERHWTQPNPYLVYRVVRPITVVDRPGSEDVDVVESLAITCEVDGADVGVAVEAVADRRNSPLAVILFQPGLARPAEWVLRYRTPGLWDPLRRDGVDRLRWAAGTLDRRYADGIGKLSVHFDFPADATGVDVSEQRGAGRIERLSETDVVYVDESRTGGLYDWKLRMKVEPGK
jgi:DNA-binding CsgD family transcriptional regulator